MHFLKQSLKIYLKTNSYLFFYQFIQFYATKQADFQQIVDEKSSGFHHNIIDENDFSVQKFILDIFQVP